MSNKINSKVNPADLIDVSKCKKNNGEYTFLHSEQK